MKPRAAGRPAGDFVCVANVCFINDFRIDDHTVVITGATSGLGHACAGVLAAPGRTVVVAARDPGRGAQAARELQDATPGARVVSLPLDLADLASVRAFPAVLGNAGLPPLRAIVANAGVQHRDRRHESAQGYEATFAVNHLGHFLLLRLLLGDLAPGGRIVIVASGTHKDQRVRNLGFPPPRWRDARALATPGPGSGQVAYATSKLANVMTMLELARRLETLRPGAGIAVHALDPGLMPDTGLDRDYPPRAQRLYDAIAPLLVRVVPGATTSAASAAQLARMAVDPAFAAPSGRYVELDHDGTPSAQARDPALAAALWTASEELVALSR